MIIGTTFSHRHLRHLRLDIDESLINLLSLKFDLVRLGIYWDESEPDPGKFDFSHIKKLLDFCEENNQDVILTVGMKAPRWPEFYLPNWLRHKKPNEIEPEVLKFMETSIKELGSYKCIKYWQVENEPLDPSGPEKLTVLYDLLKKEVELVRSLDRRQITVNLWGNELTKRNLYKEILEITDNVGIDIYYKTPSIIGYAGPKDSDEKIRNIFESFETSLWITELQAEPWERGELVAFSNNPPSMNVQLLSNNFARAKKMNPETILLWGFEYWLYRKFKNDARLWETVKTLVNNNNT